MIDKEEDRVEELKTENDEDKVKMGGWEGLCVTVCFSTPYFYHTLYITLTIIIN